MSNYTYQKIDNLVVDADLLQILSDSNNFPPLQDLRLGSTFDYTQTPNQSFFKVFIGNILLGYIWFDVERENFGYGSQSFIEVSFAKSNTAKHLEKKIFIDKVLQDLNQIKSLLPGEWFNADTNKWIGAIQPQNINRIHIKEKLEANGFQFNFNDSAFVKSVYS